MIEMIPTNQPLLRWVYDTCDGTVAPLWVFSDRAGRIRLVDPKGNTTDLTPEEYHDRVLFATREEALRRLMFASRSAHNAAARELGESLIADARNSPASPSAIPLPKRVPETRVARLTDTEIEQLRIITRRSEEDYKYVDIGREGRMLLDIAHLLKIIGYDRNTDR